MVVTIVAAPCILLSTPRYLMSPLARKSERLEKRGERLGAKQETNDE